MAASRLLPDVRPLRTKRTTAAPAVSLLRQKTRQGDGTRERREEGDGDGLSMPDALLIAGE